MRILVDRTPTPTVVTLLCVMVIVGVARRGSANGLSVGGSIARLSHQSRLLQHLCRSRVENFRLLQV